MGIISRIPGYQSAARFASSVLACRSSKVKLNTDILKPFEVTTATLTTFLAHCKMNSPTIRSYLYDLEERELLLAPTGYGHYPAARVVWPHKVSADEHSIPHPNKRFTGGLIKVDYRDPGISIECCMFSGNFDGTDERSHLEMKRNHYLVASYLQRQILALGYKNVSDIALNERDGAVFEVKI